MKHKKSYGIACCRYNPDTKKPEILLIKKRYTYYFFEFIMGRYRRYKDKYLRYMFNNMSYYEKMEILNMNFENMWNKIWFSHKYDYSVYLKKKEKFEQTFLPDDRFKRLKKLMNSTENIEPVWEIPKGRKNEDEKEMDCAIREMREETKLKPDSYRILWNVKPFIEAYTDAGVHYTNYYYIAQCLDFTWKPNIDFNCIDQISEVQDIQWFNVETIKHVKIEKKTKKRFVKMSSSILKIFKKNIKF